MFGKETKGLDEELLLENRESCVRIPMIAEARSLNLSNSAAIAVYEALRQNGFCGLECEGTAAPAPLVTAKLVLYICARVVYNRVGAADCPHLRGAHARINDMRRND